MTPVALRDQLKKLVDLQTIDSDVYNLKKELREKPAFLEDLKNQFETKKANLQKLEEKSKALLLERKSFEGELKAKEDEIIKANGQLSQLKTNKEYQAKLHEIENIKADKSIIEEKILLSFDAVDQVNDEIAKEKGVLAEEEKKYLAQKKEIDDAVKNLQDQLKGLEERRGHMTEGVDPANLSYYERILERKEGIAIVPVRSSNCGGCFMNVTQQQINQIKMHDKFVPCEMCNRILYLEDEL